MSEPLRAAVALALLAGMAPRADAVFTYAPTDSPYGITLQVGSAAAIDEVVFNATGTNAGLATGTAIAGSQSITIRVSPARPFRLLVETRPVTLTATVPAALTCTTSATCGANVIPFSAISWVSTNATSPAEGDIQNGSFVPGSTQTLASFNGATATVLLVNSDTRFMSNTLTFRYANTTVYPAGSYSGTVRFTATML